MLRLEGINILVAAGGAASIMAPSAVISTPAGQDARKHGDRQAQKRGSRVSSTKQSPWAVCELSAGR